MMMVFVNESAHPVASVTSRLICMAPRDESRNGVRTGSWITSISFTVQVIS